MRVCLILEGCYPYVRGGVSTWAHEYILSNKDIEFGQLMLIEKQQRSHCMSFRIMLLS